MECSFDRKWLHEYLDHELDPLMALILEEHLAVCPECNKELNRLKILDWDLRFADSFEIPEGELKQLRTETLDLCFAAGENEAPSSLPDIFRMQTRAAGFAVNYMRYLPGTGLLKKIGQTSKQLLIKNMALNKYLPDVGRW